METYYGEWWEGQEEEVSGVCPITALYCSTLPGERIEVESVALYDWASGEFSDSYVDYFTFAFDGNKVKKSELVGLPKEAIAGLEDGQMLRKELRPKKAKS